jgi:hypothetical protein
MPTLVASIHVFKSVRAQEVDGRPSSAFDFVIARSTASALRAVRHKLRDEAIPAALAILDCLAALAMTERDPCALRDR